MNTTPAHGLAIVGRSAALQPRTFRLERQPTSRDAAYRRLAIVIMRLDVATLADELRGMRLGMSLPGDLFRCIPTRSPGRTPTAMRAA